ncbi:MAG: hypothetical protein Q8O42_06055 [Acidobacteriota bacterium]|nr:hypothetical protein [Acidobacteriota bacterium]
MRRTVVGPRARPPRVGGRGRLIVVGGHSRGVGKTATIENLLRARANEAWVAVKISAHRHAQESSTPPVVEEAREPSPLTQTGRYLAAGAARAWLYRCPSQQLLAAAAFVTALVDSGWNVIVESNRVVRHLVPDAVIFVVSEATDDWKASSAACLRCAGAIVLAAGSSRVSRRGLAIGGSRVTRLPVFAFNQSWTVAGLNRWIDQQSRLRVTLHLNRRCVSASSPAALRPRTPPYPSTR